MLVMEKMKTMTTVKVKVNENNLKLFRDPKKGGQDNVPMTPHQIRVHSVDCCCKTKAQARTTNTRLLLSLKETMMATYTDETSAVTQHPEAGSNEKYNNKHINTLNSSTR